MGNSTLLHPVITEIMKTLTAIINSDGPSQEVKDSASKALSQILTGMYRELEIEVGEVVKSSLADRGIITP